LAAFCAFGKAMYVCMHACMYIRAKHKITVLKICFIKNHGEFKKEALRSYAYIYFYLSCGKTSSAESFWDFEFVRFELQIDVKRKLPT
jgi:hypothetical protein